jgi:hypothetical protein
MDLGREDRQWLSTPFQQLANTIRWWSQCHFLNPQEYRCRDRKRCSFDPSESLFHLFSFFLSFTLCFSPFIRSFTQNRKLDVCMPHRIAQRHKATD